MPAACSPTTRYLQRERARRIDDAERGAGRTRRDRARDRAQAGRARRRARAAARAAGHAGTRSQRARADRVAARPALSRPQRAREGARPRRQGARAPARAAARGGAQGAPPRKAAAARAKRRGRRRIAGSADGGRASRRQVASAPPVQVGGLGWPLSGTLLAGFGGTHARRPRQHRHADRARPPARTVKAVADGSVVFAEWMTGYGMILIVDHGNGYMSLYAHNDALLRDAGDRVKRGDAVASVGNSGGQGRPALYFELRRNGQPVDPRTWLQKR